MNLAQHQYLKLKNKQAGVVLFLAMIALVVMSLAAVALIRSVDTNSMISGNLSYKQTAAISSSYGIESMVDTVGPQALAYGDANDAPNGYYAQCANFDGGSADRCSGANLTADASWVPGTNSRLATGDGITPGTGRDAYGNTIQYIVERMCHQVGAPTRASCLQAGSDPDNSTKNVLNEPVAGAPKTPTELPLYRVTVRIAGPKNTVSYIQAFIS
jgi:type IV pilus assembly protein PilX